MNVDAQPHAPVERAPSFTAVLSYLAAGDGGLAVLELRAMRTADPPALAAADAHYWLGLAYLQAFDWSAATAELRAYLASDASTWRAGWAYLHLGRAYEQSGRDDEASLAYRGCLSVAGAERPARKFAFDLMSRLAGELPIGYGQAATRPAADDKRRR
jgi:Flp pilus assembly protein TadD